MFDGAFRILERHHLVVVRLCATTSLSYLFKGRKWSFAVVVVLDFSLEYSVVVKIMSLLFMERPPPRLVVLLLGVLTFSSIKVWLGALRIFIAHDQDLLGTIGLKLLALFLVLGFLGLLIILLTTFAHLLKKFIFLINSVVPLNRFGGGSISINHLEEFGDSGGRIQGDVLRDPSTMDSLLESSDDRRIRNLRN